MDDRDKLIRQLGDALYFLWQSLDNGTIMVSLETAADLSAAKKRAFDAIKARQAWEQTQPQESFS